MDTTQKETQTKKHECHSDIPREQFAMKIMKIDVCYSHVGSVLQVHTDAEEVCWAGGLTSLAANAVLNSGGRCHLLCRVDGRWHHFQHVSGARSHAKSAADASVVDLHCMGSTCHDAGTLLPARSHGCTRPQSNSGSSHASKTTKGLCLRLTGRTGHAGLLQGLHPEACWNEGS